MRIALLADMHANRQAFSACLRHAGERGAERHVLLGDFVGYGADPVYAVDTAMELVSRGAVAVLGNHDAAVNDPTIRINPEQPPILSMLRVCVACTTEPAPRKSSPLKVAWLKV